MQTQQDIQQIVLTELKNKFERYFVFAKSDSKQSGLSGFGRVFGFRPGDGRENLSEIIEGQVYLGPITKCQNFIQRTAKLNGGLVVSCLDISELASSGLLLEPEPNKINYHILAMEDKIATVGSIDQVHDALKLMLSFSAQQKPIYIHCYEGVGRSPMLTALHIAHRYLLEDPVIRYLIDRFNQSQITLFKSDNENYIGNLYKVVKDYVKSRRSCCQFDERNRYELAINVLSTLHRQIQAGQKVVDKNDQNYSFLAELVQSSQFKSLQHYCMNSLSWHDRLNIYAPETKENAEGDEQRKVIASIDPQQCIIKFFKLFLLNKQQWYQQIIDATKVEQTEVNTANPLLLFLNCVDQSLDRDQNAIKNKRQELILGLLNSVHQLAAKYPQALFSQTIAAYIEKPVLANTALLLTM
jgi:protein-tyrosine phosphatase